MKWFDSATLESFDVKQLWRNLPTSLVSKDLFYPGEFTDREKLILQRFADYDSGVEHTVDPKDRWAQYGELERLDFLFDKLNFPTTRFSDGSFPVWYGADSENCSKAETAYHLIRQARKDAPPGSKKPIICQRAMYKAAVHCQAGVDLVPFIPTHPEILEDGPPYPACNDIGRRASGRNCDGLRTKSKRFPKGTCYAVFNRESVVKSMRVSGYELRVHLDGREADIYGVPLSEALAE